MSMYSVEFFALVLQELYYVQACCMLSVSLDQSCCFLTTLVLMDALTIKCSSVSTLDFVFFCRSSLCYLWQPNVSY